jgi:hypothetical protein
MIRFLKEKLTEALKKEVFLDSDDLRDLRGLLGHVRKSEALVVLQSAGVLTRPWCLLEMYAAIEASVPIIAISMTGKGYDFASAVNLLQNLETSLDKLNPGAADLLRSEDVDLTKMAFTLSSVLPNIISVPFNSSSSGNAIKAALLDIVDALQDASPLPPPKDLKKWLEKRGGTVAATTTVCEHGSAASSKPVVHAADTVSNVLASVPVAVPDLPQVVMGRDVLASNIRESLIGKESSSVAISSTKKSKVAAHGQGGVGKTLMAVLTVNDPLVRAAFECIGWVSVGQTPSIMEMQRVLYQQLTGNPMVVKDNATAVAQLADLQAACAGKRWLLVLDDVWDKDHEQLLNCVDPDSESKVLITTRIRGLMQGSNEVSLNELSPDEATDLLLRTGQVEDTSDAAITAATEIAVLCGHLPLYLSICGGVILGYEGSPDWQIELPGMLKEDRVGVVDDGTGDSMGERLVGSSLRMLKDKAALSAFMALGVVPEDVLVTLPAAQLICSTTGKVSAISMRRSIKALLDRNLLQGSMASGVQMHDIVRDLVRSRLDVDGGLREKQRATVAAFADGCPADGWAGDDEVGQYANQALRQHMVEALLPDPLQDVEAQAWLDASDDVMSHPLVRCAADAFGFVNLSKMGEQLEAEGKLWEAAKRFTSAACTEDLSKLGMAVALDVAAGGGIAADGTQNELTFALRAGDLLVRSEQVNVTRSFEAALRCRIAMRLPWADPIAQANMARIKALLKEGVTVTSPPMLLAVGWGEACSNLPMLGFTAETSSNMANPEIQLEGIKGGIFSEHLGACGDSVPRGDPTWVYYNYFKLHWSGAGGGNWCQHALGRELIAKFCSHDMVADVIEGYDHDVHHQMFTTGPVGANMCIMGCPPASVALIYYGDISLVRTALLKLCTIFECNDARLDPSLFPCAYYTGLAWTNPWIRAIGLGDLSLRLLRALHITSAEVVASAAIYNGVVQYFGFTGETHCYATESYLIANSKRRHWLLAPDEVGKATMEEWLATAPAEWGGNGQGELVDCGPFSVGLFCAGGAPEVFESLERYEEAIIAAETDIRNWPTMVSMQYHGIYTTSSIADVWCLFLHIQPVVLMQSHTAAGRCHAKLGRPVEATAAFEAAIAEVYRCELPFLEVLARRDFIVHVLDAEGRRDSQLAALGGAISRLVLEPSEYAAILGSGIDAEAAVAAFRAQ